MNDDAKFSPRGLDSVGLLKMSELAQRSGVSAGTIKHYLREGLLDGEGEGVVRTSRNMAYYPPGYVERITLIKRLQEDRFMPLKVIKGMLDEDPDRALALVELEDKIIERALERRDTARVSAAEIRRRYDLPANVLERLVEIGVLTPNGRGYDADDVAIIEAMVRFRAGGYDETLGFTVYDTLRYREALQPLVEEEIATMLGRLAGEVEPDRAADIIASGADPLRELPRRDALQAVAGRVGAAGVGALIARRSTSGERPDTVASCPIPVRRFSSSSSGWCLASSR